MPPKNPIETVQDWLDHVDSLRERVSEHSHLRLWFRGHADFAWELEPGVYRPDFQPSAKTEDDRLRKERHLTQDFRVVSAGVRDSQLTDVDLYFLQQHYGMPTRLLDWTSDALAALYFAVANEALWGRDGSVAMLDAYRFSGFTGIATGRRNSVRDAVARIAAWDDLRAFPRTTFPLRPDRSDVRMSLQRAGFTFHVPSQSRLTVDLNPTLQVIPVAAGAKKNLRHQLAALGADDFGVYGDLDSLSRHLKWAYSGR